MKLFKKAISALLATSMLATSLISVSAADVSNVESKKVELPSAYSSAEQGYITPVKDQGESNMCCSYASMAACESSMIINNGYDTTLDLSELHSHYTLHRKPVDKMGMFDSSPRTMNFVDNGSHVSCVLFNLVNHQGVVTESANHGQFASSKIHKTFEVYNPESTYSIAEAYIKNAYKAYTTTPDLVKELIIKYGAGAGEISVGYVDYNGDKIYHLNEETGAYYCYRNEAPNHAITVVGWDDNYPKENCTNNGYTPENDGAWLIKNSGGTDNVNNGYNWVSYEDSSISKYALVFYELSTDEPYANTYQYDDLCEEDFLYGISGGVYMSNMFTAKKDNETLEAVSFYTSNEYLDYTVEIYTGVEGNTDPTNGTLKATVSGEDLLMGYHTIELPTPVQLEKGEQFSVVVNIKDNENPSRDVKVNIDYSSYLIGYSKISDFGEGFTSSDGKSWDDVKYSVDGNLRIKAFTNCDEEPAEVIDYYDSYNGKTREKLFNEFNNSLNEFDNDLESNYCYKLSYTLELFMENYNGYKQVCENPEKYLAIEFDGMKKDLEFYFENVLTKYDFSNIEYYKTLPQWQEFTKVYDDTLVKFKANEMTDYDSQLCDDVYNELVSVAIENGGNNSYLQDFGDTDGGGDINIADATLIQMLIAKYDEFDLVKYYNSDVNGDGNINILDATLVQMYASKFIEYFPVYDKQFDNEEVNANIDLDTAVANLSDAVANVENSSFFDFVFTGNVNYTTVKYLYNDAVEVLENPENYRPNIIDFKARCLNNSLQSFEV